ncbi:hypothetical protein FE257_005664 [Aspergillus nanangensis]|uniref:Velvet complex subunit laeA n=1 Tax=Aspergillus nanangensis TaxID=2582783 RepID=A0AAD4CBC0_ASPNN|nr:hypothetical protein FE257_005664 [Aspergillus nanangensis]
MADLSAPDSSTNQQTKAMNEQSITDDNCIVNGSTKYGGCRQIPNSPAIVQDIYQGILHDNELLNAPHQTSFFSATRSGVCLHNSAAYLAKCHLTTTQPQVLAPGIGRMYEGPENESYILPCDEQEQDRLDFFHAMFAVALSSNKLIHVPHPSNGRFIDLGCGTGIWAIEVAKAYPNAYVLGVDISMIQPVYRPENCFFRSPFNYELPWLLGEGKWDVVRLQIGCGSIVDWPGLYQRVFSHLLPGAWLEQIEIDFKPRCYNRSLDGTSLHY